MAKSVFKLSKRSLENLAGVHPDLVAVVDRALELTNVDFTVIDGLRSRAEQQKLVARGASKTMNSRHLTGHAVDIAPFVDGKVSWHWPDYYPLAGAIKTAAEELGVPIEWGGDWTSFKDGPHWQLPWGEYGKDDMIARHKQTPPQEAAKSRANPSWISWILEIIGRLLTRG